MRNFEHANAVSFEGAIRLLESGGSSRIIVGGTDLLSEMKPGIATPDRLVNIKTIPSKYYIRFGESNGLQIGTLATLTAIAEHDAVRKRYPALTEAIALAASPQLRNRGTIGGNVCQDSRCWYYRGPFLCWLKGGEICYAKDGENAYHAVFDGDTVKDVRLVLGGVASRPWRVLDAEAALQGRLLDNANIDRAADLAVAGAQPLRNNRYKIPLVKGLIVEAPSALKD